MRKSFAQRLYDRTGDIYLVQELLGHRNIATTQNYLGVNYASVRKACDAIVLGSEPYKFSLLSRSEQTETAKTLTDETLMKELRKRGYNHLDLRENPTTAEIVKIS